MILLNFFARALVFHVLLIPVITLFGAMVLLILVKLKKAPAALRAGISGATLMVILILPWAAITVPKVTIPIFSAVPDAQTESLDRHLPPPGIILPPPDLSEAPAAPSELTSSSELSKASPAIKSSTHYFNWWVLVVAVILALVCGWVLGIAWGFGVLMLGMVGIIRLRWSSRLVTDTRLINALSSSCERLNCRGSVLFLISDQIALPITWGWLQAKIALPQDALNWPSERIDAALLHELAHIKRRDFAIQTLSRFTCVFHWYNPLVLRLFRAWKSDAEQACDDLVLRSGYSGERYSDILLEVWRSATIPRPQSSLGLAMVRSSTLEQRVVAILDPEREREEISPRKRKQLFALFGGITILIAVISLTRPTNYHLTPELQNDMQAILHQVQTQENTHLALQLGLERQQEYWSSAKGAFEPQPQPTVADITLELTGMKGRYRAQYHPAVNGWMHGTAPFYIENKTDVSDGDNTWTILSERHDNFMWKAGGDIGLLAGYGYRADDQVRTVINGLEGNGFTPFNGASYGIERTVLNGAPAIRVQDIITSGGTQRRTWWFDPQRDYALIQYELADFNGGSTQPTYSEIASIQQMQKVADGIWYPTQFTTQNFRYESGQLTDDSFRSTTKITSLVPLPTISPTTFQPSTADTPQSSPSDSTTITVTPIPPPGVEWAKIEIQSEGSFKTWKLSPDGRSLQAQLPPNNYRLRAVCRTRTGSLYFSEPRYIKVTSSTHSIHLDLNTLLAAFQVKGILDASVPRPIKNGMVIACVTSGSTASEWNGWLLWNISAEIHPDGTFEISNLPPPTKPTGAAEAGQLELIALCDGYVSKDPSVQRAEYSVGPQVFTPPISQPINLAMEPTSSARVRVLDPQGDPLAGLAVRFLPNQSFHWISTALGSPMNDEKALFDGWNGDPLAWQKLMTKYQSTTDNDGVAVVNGLPSGFEPYVIVNAAYDMPFRLRLDQSSSKYAQNGIVTVTAGAQATTEMRLIPKMQPIAIPNSVSPNGKYVVSVEANQPGYDPQAVVIRNAKTHEQIVATRLPCNPEHEVDLVSASDKVKVEWNPSSSFFIFSVWRTNRLDMLAVGMDDKGQGYATTDLSLPYGTDSRVLSYEFIGKRTIKLTLETGAGKTFFDYDTVEENGAVHGGSSPDASAPKN